MDIDPAALMNPWFHAELGGFNLPGPAIPGFQAGYFINSDTGHRQNAAQIAYDEG